MGTCGFPEVDWSLSPAKLMSTRLRKSDKYLPSKNKVKISTVLNDSGQTKEPQNGVKVSHSAPLVEYTRLCASEAVPALPPLCESRVLLLASPGHGQRWGQPSG